MKMHKVVFGLSHNMWVEELLGLHSMSAFVVYCISNKKVVNCVIVCPAEYSVLHQNICPLRCPSPLSLKKEAPSNISGAPCECSCACFNVLTDKNYCKNGVAMVLIKEPECINVSEKDAIIMRFLQHQTFQHHLGTTWSDVTDLCQ